MANPVSIFSPYYIPPQLSNLPPIQPQPGAAFVPKSPSAQAPAPQPMNQPPQATPAPAQASQGQITAKDGTPLDASVVNLAKAIRTVESNGNFNASGGSGEHGAYQWMPGNFQAQAKHYLGIDNANASDPILQDKVAYAHILDLKNQGKTPAQIASIWNSGSPNWQGKVGVNSYGVKYDTPAYVDKVIGQFQKLKGATSTQNPDGTPTAQTATQITPPPLTPPPAAGGLANTLGALDQKASNMGGVLGTLGSGIYNAAKGIGSLIFDTGKDVFHLINHPIDTIENTEKFLGNELTQTDTANTDSLQKLFQSTLGSKGALGVGQQVGNAIADATGMANNTFSGGKLAGNAVNTILTAVTAGSGSLAEQGLKSAVENGLLEKSVAETLSKAATSFAGRSLESGTIGAGFQVGSNLQNGAPITQDLGKGFATGLAVPGVMRGAGAVSDVVGGIAAKVPGVNKFVATSASDAAKILTNAIGFRGGNRMEAAQFTKSAPIVLEELQKSGFKVTDHSDPNNVINLQKAVDAAKTSIINERNARIKASGGYVAPMEGKWVGDALREIPKENPKMFFERPELAQKIEALAQQYDGKTFTPEEAQQFIKTANQTFDFGNQDTAVQNLINGKVSKALTDALDKHVANGAGADAGTAVLNKKWSALKTFSDQLDKKVIMEQRKAPNDLPSRLNVPQAVGKVAEGIANPLGAFGKAMGAGAQYITNKIMGDRNNVNYKIWKAFNQSPIGEGIVAKLNTMKTPAAVTDFLTKNPLIQHLLERIYGKSEFSDNENASPTTLYHGTAENNLNVLQPGKEGNIGKGIYLTDHPAAADYYASLASEAKQLNSGNFTGKIPKGNTLSVQLDPSAKIQNFDHLPTQAEVQAAKQNGFHGVSYPDSILESVEGKRGLPNGTKATMMFDGSKLKIQQPKSNFGRSGPAFEPASDLAPADRAVESKAFSKITNNEQQILADYKQKYGNVVNTDAFRPMFTDVGYNGSNAAAVQEPASYLAKKAYADALKNNPGEFASFTSGMSGAGKSTALKNIPAFEEIKNNSAVILDSNLSTYDSAVKKLNEAEAAGKHPAVFYVYRDPIDGFVNGVVKRMRDNPDEMGRIVPTKVVAENAKGSWDVAKRLDTEGYDVHFIDNSNGPGGQQYSDAPTIAKKANFPSNLNARLNAEVKKLYDSKQITKQQYNAYVG